MELVSDIDGLFEIPLMQSRMCTCGGLTEIPNTKEKLLTLAFPPDKGEDRVTLNQMIDHFVDIEQISADNAVECMHCGMRTTPTAVQTFTVPGWRTVSGPKLFAIALKRFEFSMDSRRYTKIHRKVSFPLNMDLSKMPGSFISGKYRLVGVVHHLGEGGGAGHYVCDFLDGETWVHANDSLVEEITHISTSSKTAYLLLYERLH